MNNQTKVRVTVSRQLNSSADRIFDAWLDPSKACKFLFATPSGKMVRAEIDAHVGGPFVLVDRRDGVDVEHCGKYLEIDRPRRLVFTFSVPLYSAEITRVTIDIVPLERGCELTLTHDDVLPEYETQTKTGWNMILDALQALLPE